ncbi:hypothetical protein CALCODRAFT_518476 [Calocera cornea HHB12733]|uniref:Uncharacterized protein n=1 Tax=Calocera cornea HHB12733 TaxID=1353952 RepID=A0A165EZP6_9BASI|nr:hypothetical protein CALCODRAFT_518476 [Calocera cornea HHB12733]
MPPNMQYPPEQGHKIGWITLPPTRYILARACLVPLTAACGVGLVLSIVGIPLTGGYPKYRAVVAAELVIFVLSALWAVMQAATISHRDFFLHQTRVWTWSLGIGFLFQSAVFIGWIVTVMPSFNCPELPECETTLGGICPQDQLDIYNDILVCQVNWGLLGANIALLLLELCAIFTVFIMRVLPAWQAPERGIWYGSIYAPWEVKWRFEPAVPSSGSTRSTPMVSLGKLNPFKRRFREPQPPTVRISTMRDPPDTPATVTTFSSDHGDWLKMKGLSGPASAPTETDDGSRRSSMV